jgi:O-antigen biosynthesis protein
LVRVSRLAYGCSIVEGQLMSSVSERVAFTKSKRPDQAVVVNLKQTASALSEIQTEFLTLEGKAGQTAQVFVDVVSRQEGCLVLLGWSTAAALDMVLEQDGRTWPLDLNRHTRDDVAKAFGLESGAYLGFAIVCDAPVADRPVSLQIALPRCPHVQTVPLLEKVELSLAERRLLPALMMRQYLRLRRLIAGSPAWHGALDLLPEAVQPPDGCHGFIEGAFGAGHGGVVYGWALHPEDAVIWLEDERLAVFPLEKQSRSERRDIADAFADVAWAGMDAGFMAYLPQIGSGSRVRLRLATSEGLLTLAESTGFEVLAPDPLTVAARLCSVDHDNQPSMESGARVFWPLLAPLITRQQAEYVLLRPGLKVFGVPHSRPEVSVIIPYRGGADLMEHQLLEFARDPDFLAATEIVFVVCDPAARQEAWRIADLVHRLFGLALTVVSVPRRVDAFSARNLAAQHAKGRYLLFLESTVLPLKPCWLKGLLAGFEADAGAGAIGARLLTPEGAITHGGSGFYGPSAPNDWLMRDSHAGLPDTLVGDGIADKTSAISDACFLVRRNLFESLGGWSTAYLPGKGAALDFCMGLRRRGLHAFVQPDVKLIKLEEVRAQSADDRNFSQKAEKLNAMRFNDLWADEIDSMARASA